VDNDSSEGRLIHICANITENLVIEEKKTAHNSPISAEFGPHNFSIE